MRWCVVPTPTAPCQHPIVQVRVLSHDQSLAPVIVHPICLVLAIQMNKLNVRALLRLSAHDAPLDVSIAIALPSPIGTTIFLSEVSPSAHATHSLLLPFFSYPSAFARCTCHAATSLPEYP